MCSSDLAPCGFAARKAPHGAGDAELQGDRRVVPDRTDLGGGAVDVDEGEACGAVAPAVEETQIHGGLGRGAAQGAPGAADGLEGQAGVERAGAVQSIDRLRFHKSVRKFIACQKQKACL